MSAATRPDSEAAARLRGWMSPCQPSVLNAVLERGAAEIERLQGDARALRATLAPRQVELEQEVIRLRAELVASLDTYTRQHMECCAAVRRLTDITEGRGA